MIKFIAFSTAFFIFCCVVASTEIIDSTSDQVVDFVLLNETTVDWATPSEHSMESYEKLEGPKELLEEVVERPFVEAKPMVRYVNYFRDLVKPFSWWFNTNSFDYTVGEVLDVVRSFIIAALQVVVPLLMSPLVMVLLFPVLGCIFIVYRFSVYNAWAISMYWFILAAQGYYQTASVYLAVYSAAWFVSELVLACRRLSLTVKLRRLVNNPDENVDPRLLSSQVILLEKYSKMSIQWVSFRLMCLFLLPTGLVGIGLVVTCLYSRGMTATHVYECFREAARTAPIPFVSGGMLYPSAHAQVPPPASLTSFEAKRSSLKKSVLQEVKAMLEKSKRRSRKPKHTEPSSVPMASRYTGNEDVAEQHPALPEEDQLVYDMDYAELTGNPDEDWRRMQVEEIKDWEAIRASLDRIRYEKPDLKESVVSREQSRANKGKGKFEALQDARPNVCVDPPTHPLKKTRFETVHVEAPKVPTGIYAKQISVRVGEHVGYAFGTSAGVVMPLHVWKEAVGTSTLTSEKVSLMMDNKSISVDPALTPIEYIPAEPDSLVLLQVVWPFAALTPRLVSSQESSYAAIKTTSGMSSSQCTCQGAAVSYKASTVPGDSGGFVVNKDGKVFAIHQQGGPTNVGTRLTPDMMKIFFRPFKAQSSQAEAQTSARRGGFRKKPRYLQPS